MAPRALGALLALAAAIAFVVSIVSSAWWQGPPTIDGQTIEAKDVSVGLLTAQGCNSGGDGECTDVTTGLEMAFYAELGGIGLAVLVTFALTISAWTVGDRRKGISTLSLIVTLLVGGGGGALLALGPDIQASETVVVPIGWGAYVFGGAVASSLLASLIARTIEPEPLRLKTGIRTTPLPDAAPSLRPPYEQQGHHNAGFMPAQTPIPMDGTTIRGTGPGVERPRSISAPPPPGFPSAQMLASDASDASDAGDSGVRPESSDSGVRPSSPSASPVARESGNRLKSPSSPPASPPPLARDSGNRLKSPSSPPASARESNHRLTGLAIGDRSKSPSTAPGGDRPKSPSTAPAGDRPKSPSTAPAGDRANAPSTAPATSPSTALSVDDRPTPLAAGRSSSPTGGQPPDRSKPASVSPAANRPSVPSPNRVRSLVPSPARGTPLAPDPAKPPRARTTPGPGTDPSATPLRPTDAASEPVLRPSAPTLAHAVPPMPGPDSMPAPPELPARGATAVEIDAEAKAKAAAIEATARGTIDPRIAARVVRSSTEARTGKHEARAADVTSTGVTVEAGVDETGDDDAETHIGALPDAKRLEEALAEPPPPRGGLGARIKSVLDGPRMTATHIGAVPEPGAGDDQRTHIGGVPDEQDQRTHIGGVPDEPRVTATHVGAVPELDSGAVVVDSGPVTGVKITPAPPSPTILTGEERVLSTMQRHVARAPTEDPFEGRASQIVPPDGPLSDELSVPRSVEMAAEAPVTDVHSIPSDSELADELAAQSASGSIGDTTDMKRTSDLLPAQRESEQTPIPTFHGRAPTPMSTAPSTLPAPRTLETAPSGPRPACPQCEAPMAWVEEHLRFYCKQCRMYF